MKREGLHRQQVLVRGEFEDVVMFAVLESEWRASR